MDYYFGFMHSYSLNYCLSSHLSIDPVRKGECSIMDYYFNYYICSNKIVVKHPDKFLLGAHTGAPHPLDLPLMMLFTFLNFNKNHDDTFI